MEIHPNDGFDSGHSCCDDDDDDMRGRCQEKDVADRKRNWEKAPENLQVAFAVMANCNSQFFKHASVQIMPNSRGVRWRFVCSM